MDSPHEWVSYLAWVKFVYNISYHEKAGVAPFKVLYGRQPPTIPMYLRGTSKLEAMDYELQKREEVLSLLKTHLEAA